MMEEKRKVYTKYGNNRKKMEYEAETEEARKGRRRMDRKRRGL
jgi:hypothetical protein